MQCKDCKHFKNIANTDECGQGLCGFPTSFFPTTLESECVYLPKPYTCGDCARFADDFACFTCKKEDSAYIDGKLCPGFEDTKEDDLYNILANWQLRGFNIEDKLNSVLEKFKDFKSPLD